LCIKKFENKYLKIIKKISVKKNFEKKNFAKKKFCGKKNCVSISVFPYLFKNKTIEDKSESEAL
jgi:hypothetical protein